MSVENFMFSCIAIVLFRAGWLIGDLRKRVHEIEKKLPANKIEWPIDPFKERRNEQRGINKGGYKRNSWD